MAQKLVPFVFGTLALMLLVAPTASAASVSLTIVAQESCSDSTYCFEVTQGDVTSIQPGDDVTVTFENDGASASVHNFYVAAQGDADVGGNTAESAAIANTTDVEPGDSTTVSFTAPSDASGLYFWCDVAGHEALGMYINQAYAGGNGGDGDGGDSSMPAWTMVVAFAAVSLALARRTRD